MQGAHQARSFLAPRFAGKGGFARSAAARRFFDLPSAYPQERRLRPGTRSDGLRTVCAGARSPPASTSRPSDRPPPPLHLATLANPDGCDVAASLLPPAVSGRLGASSRPSRLHEPTGMRAYSHTRYFPRSATIPPKKIDQRLTLAVCVPGRPPLGVVPGTNFPTALCDRSHPPCDFPRP